MDRAEAIKLLKPFRNSMVDQYGCPISDVVFALDLAIDALKAQEKPLRSDLIQREDVLDLAKDGKIISNTNYEKVVAHINNIPSANTTDCISRQQAIEAFCDDCRGLKPGQCEHWDSCKSQQELRSLPPVTPTERTGEWIEHDPKTKRLAKIYECPFCGDEVIGEKTNFCTNCGAKNGGDME